MKYSFPRSPRFRVLRGQEQLPLRSAWLLSEVGERNDLQELNNRGFGIDDPFGLPRGEPRPNLKDEKGPQSRGKARAPVLWPGHRVAEDGLLVRGHGQARVAFRGWGWGMRGGRRLINALGFRIQWNQDILVLG